MNDNENTVNDEISEITSYWCADLGSNNSGYYDLQAVLTHQGRSSSSGHYLAWVKRKEGEEGVYAVYTSLYL